MQTLLSTSPNIVGLIPEPSSQSAGFVLFYLERERGDFDSMWPFLSMGHLGNLDEAYMSVWVGLGLGSIFRSDCDLFFHQTSTKTTP